MRVDLSIFGWSRLDPSFRPDQGHEGDRAEVLLLEAILASAADAQQRLVNIAPDRDDQSPADRELLLQRLGHLWAAGGNDDGVERGLVRQSLGAVAADDLDIVVAKPLQARARLIGELLVALDGVDLVGDAADHGRGVAGPCADFENLIAGLELPSSSIMRATI